MYKNKKFNMSWKQYGGIYRTDKYHNVSMGTLVADQLVLRQTASTKLTFDSSILVKGSINIENNIDASGSITGQDLFVRKNIYLNNKLYFGTNTAYDDSNETACYIYGSSTGIGINTKTPRSPFDITAPDAIANVLTVRSQTTTNTNTIAQNNTNKAIIVNASNASSFIGFFNDTSNNINNSPDAKLQYTASTLSASGVLETISNIVKLSPNVYVYNRGSRTIPATNTIYDEPMIIYDNSQNRYLYQYYNKTDVRSGNAMTLAAIDNKSNTFLRIVSPNKLGLALGGGADPYNNSYSMATFGITDSSGNYYQNQMILQGTDKIKNKTTLGINTFYPKINKYALDVNGRTRITNGEVNIVSYLNFEVKKISFSKTNPLIGIIVGTASTISPYIFYISYTKDGGKNWTNSTINNSNLQTTNHEFTVHLFDSNYAIIGTSNSFAFYTRNGGISWNLITLKGNDNFLRDIKTVFFSNYQVNNAYRIFFAGLIGDVENQTPTIPKIFFYDVNINVLLNGTDVDLTNYYENTSLANASFFIKNSHGAGNILYFVGNGIQKVDITVPASVYYIKTDKQYNSVYAYDSNFAVAVGVNIISYTTNGSAWTDITFSNITFNDVFIYDSTSAVAVGNNGKFYYTTNGTTWDVVPDTIINSSGISNLITDSNYKLSNIVMSDKDSIIISSITTPYVSNSVVGQSRILYGYYPNLFNRANNTVLELSGNIVISGDIEINDSGKLKTTQTTFNLLTENVQTMNIANSSTNINVGNSSTTTNINGNLNVTNNTQINSNLTAGATIINSTLDVSGTSNLKKNLYVVGDTSLNSKLYTAGAAQLNSSLDVIGNTTLNSNLSVTSDTILNSKLNTAGATTLNSTLDVTGTSNLKQNLYVVGDTSLNSKLYIAGNTVINSLLTVAGNTTLNNRLTVAGNTTLNNRLTVDNDTTLNNRLNVANDTTLNTKLLVQGDVSMNSRLGIQGDVSMNSKLSVENDASFNKNISVKENIYNGGTLYSNNIELINNDSINIGTSYIDNLQTNIFKNINIGYNTNNVRNKSKIIIGSGPDDEIIIKGVLKTELAVQNVQAPTTIKAQGKVINLNDGNTNPDIGGGAGITITDNSINDAGYILQNYSMTGYMFKPSKPNSNTLNIEINSMRLSPQINTGLVVLKKSPDFSDASYNMIIENIDTSSILLRSTASTDSNQIITSILTTNNTLITNGDVSMNSRLFVGGDSSLNNVNVQGISSFNNTLITNADVSMNSRLFVGGDSSLNNVNVQGISTFNNTLITNGDVSMNSRLFVGGDSSLNNVNVQGISTFNNTLITNADVSMNSRLSVNGDASMNNLNTNSLSSITALLNKLGIGINNILPNIALDVSGNFRITNGVVVQFYE